MNDDLKNKSVSEMLRLTNENSYEFYKAIASHIEELEATIVKLNNELVELKGATNGHDE